MMWVLCLNKHFGGAERYSKEPSKLSISAVARVLTKRFSVSLCNSPVSVFVPPLIHTEYFRLFLTLSMLRATFLCRFLTAVCCQILLECVDFPRVLKQKPTNERAFFCTVGKSEFCIWKYCPTKLKNSNKYSEFFFCIIICQESWV